ncbi:putative transcription factor C16C4.22 [Golovinomyces cichoracearum]|uniref:Putative transcription factor C16C4.22 n=1 Tax=Golovinomyces cichoracearum TaxID=62708 RepID=A0A420IEA7_9PEZI|nr:putative transcription factor C16C4.22 [Golovinomyces cichoracearum]
MPYNTSAIIPSEEPTGTTQLPFSRVKKIIATDQDIQIMSNAGAFVITVATEMFIQHLAQEALKVVKSERKPRRNIQYRDLATAISNHENLEFLVDIVPNTTTFKQVKEKKTLLSSTDQSQTQEPKINDSIVANVMKCKETSVSLTPEFCGDQITTTSTS